MQSDLGNVYFVSDKTEPFIFSSISAQAAACKIKVISQDTVPRGSGFFDSIIIPAADFLNQPSELPPALFFPFGESSLLGAALNKGAADYLKTPWDFEEFLCRKEKACRKYKRSCIAGGALWGNIFSLQNKSVVFSPSESIIFQCLCRYENQIVSQKFLMELLEDAKLKTVPGDATRTLDTRICRLRQKLRSFADFPFYPVIDTIYRRGYRMHTHCC